MFANSWGHAGRIALAAIFVLPSAHAQSELQSNRFDLLAALDPVVVTASKIEEPRGQATVLIDVIQRDEIEASGVISISELLDRLPGINIIRQYGRLGIDASIDIGYLGGSSHHRTLIMVDGVRVNDVDDGTVSLSAIPLSAIERIEIRRAGGGVLFGDRALGGVINIITKPEKKNRTVVTGSAGSFGLRTIGTSISRVANENSIHLDAKHAKLDGYRRNSQQEQTSLLSRILIPTKIGELGFVFRASDENLSLPAAITIQEFKIDPKNPGGYQTNSRRENRSGTVTLDTQFSPTFKTSIKLNTEDLERRSSTTYITKRNSFIFDSTKNYGLTTLLFGAEAFHADSLSNRPKRSKVVQSSNALYFSLEQNFETAKVMLGARSQAMKNEFFTTAESAAQTSSDRLTSWSLAAKKPVFGGDLRGGLQSSFAFPNTDQLFTFGSLLPFAPKSIYPDISPMKSLEAQVGWFMQKGQNTFDFSIRHVLIKDEIGFKSNCIGTDNCNDNLYDTERVVFTGRYSRNLDLNTKFDIGLDLVQAKIDSGVNTGNRIPLTPTKAIKMSLSHGLFNGNASVVGHYRSAMYANEDNANSGLKIPGRTLVDLGWSGKLTQNADIQFWFRNILDKKYYDFAQYLDSFSIQKGWDGVAPGDGRSIDFSLRYKF